MATAADLNAAAATLAAAVRTLQADADVDGWTVYRLPPSEWALVSVYPEPTHGVSYMLVEHLGPTKGDALSKLEGMIAGITLAQSFVETVD